MPVPANPPTIVVVSPGPGGTAKIGKPGEELQIGFTRNAADANPIAGIFRQKSGTPPTGSPTVTDLDPTSLHAPDLDQDANQVTVLIDDGGGAPTQQVIKFKTINNLPGPHFMDCLANTDV